MARASVVALLAVLAATLLAGPAAAREVVLRAAERRSLRFDVRADVDVGWYAGLLRRAAHANEIERVTIPDRRLGRARGACSCRGPFGTAAPRVVASRSPAPARSAAAS